MRHVLQQTLFDIGAWATARRTLERIRDVDGNDGMRVRTISRP
ncbi:hypothetical protein BH24ACI5_BH24ACI5_14040 [soil metagenome]|jgi:hypothetical protein